MTPQHIIFSSLADGKSILDIGKHKVQIGDAVIHYRFKNTPPKGEKKFPFGINHNSLTADYGLFICGNEQTYYLIPAVKVKMMYDHPKAYVDNTHPDIRAITIDAARNRASYAKPSIWLDLTPYKNCLLVDNLKTNIQMPSLEEISIRKYGTSGEGELHRQLKNQIANNPSLINIANVTQTENDTHTFPSSDRPDIIFTCSGDKFYIVEIEIENCVPGAYQAIKYKSLFCAEKGFPLDADNVVTMLVARKINSDVKQFCQKYGVIPFEKPEAKL